MLDQGSRLFRRKKTPAILPRDTDKDWAVIGASEPYYGVWTLDRFKRANIDEQAIADFFGAGRSEVDRMLSYMRGIGPFTPSSALDFGCGVGRLTLPLSEATGSATGVDISPGMLAEARKRERDGLTFVDALPDGQFDWVTSITVLQHIPPERGYGILKQLLDRVSTNGGASIQFMFARTPQHRDSIGAKTIIADGVAEKILEDRDPSVVPSGTMLVYDYDMSIVIAMFYAAGMQRLMIEHCDHGGMVGAIVYGLKTVTAQDSRTP